MLIAWVKTMINVSGVSKKFENVYALKDVSCTIPKGAIYGMVGSMVRVNQHF